jgi:hypothetical protein
MFFLLRMTFWLTVLLAVLPLFAGRDAPSNQTAESKFSAGDAFTVASATVSDLSQFCTRRPEACNAGAEVLSAIGSNAQQGVKIVLRYLTGKSAADSASAPDGRDGAPKSVRTIPVRAIAPSGTQASRETLLPADLGLQWRGTTPG